MNDFENNLLKLIVNIQFRTVSDEIILSSDRKFYLQINCLYLLIEPKIIMK